MEKEKYLHQVNKFKINKKSKRLFAEQVNLFYDYNNSNYQEYNIGDSIKLSNNNLIHGSRAKMNELEIISKEGLISSEFYSDFNPQKKKPYVVELWDIKEDIYLSDWIKKYTGVTIDYKNREGKVFKSDICSLDDIKRSLNETKDFRDYIIYQNQEQRFLPNDYIDNDADLAFIIEFDNNDKLIDNDIFNVNFDKKILKNILPKWFYKKYMENRNFDNYETGREKAILFGIPISMFRGIIVSRNKEKDNDYLNALSIMFTNCYICNLDGKVIKTRDKNGNV